MKSTGVHTLRFRTEDGGKVVLKTRNHTDEEILEIIRMAITELNYTYLGEKAEPWYKRIPSSIWWFTGGSLYGHYVTPWLLELING